MQRRSFGQTGLEVPILGFGAMQAGDPRLDDDAAGRLLHRALDLGFGLIDTARSYGLSEERIGRHLAHRRDEFVLSTKVGYGVAGIADWTYECIVAGVDAARERLRCDVIDIVHLHSCGSGPLEEEAVTRGLVRCAELGKLRVAAYSGDGAALRYAIGSGAFGGVQASFSICDQQAARPLAEARACGLGTLAKRPLAGRPWAPGAPPADAVHAEYRRRFDALRPGLGPDPGDWDALALRFAAFESGVDCVLVGGTNVTHLEHNRDAVAHGPLAAAQSGAIRQAFRQHGADWTGLV
jgi:aryl-alcohol dehydrogenase-like predicted oxidoreductase